MAKTFNTSGSDLIIYQKPDPNHQIASYIGNTTLFQGREYDQETGLYYFRARYLNPELGRFMQPDPKGYVDSMNPYESFGNNPENFADPMGSVLKKIQVTINKYSEREIDLNPLYVSEHRNAISIIESTAINLFSRVGISLIFLDKGKISFFRILGFYVPEEYITPGMINVFFRGFQWHQGTSATKYIMATEKHDIPPNSDIVVGKSYPTSFIIISTNKNIDISQGEYERVLFHELAHTFGIRAKGLTIPLISNWWYDRKINKSLLQEIGRFDINRYNSDEEIKKRFPLIYKIRKDACLFNISGSLPFTVGD